MISRSFGLMLVLFSYCLASFAQFPNVQKSKQEMIQADIAFSSLSQKLGMKKAFLTYIDDQAILLKPGHFPIVGKQAKDYLKKANDSFFILTWKPIDGSIARSGDFGYTYGVYVLTLKDTIMEGNYVTIWKKDSEGKWKFVLDTGNEGLGKK